MSTKAVDPGRRASHPPSHIARSRRLKVSLAVWGVAMVTVTVLWVAHQWQANGALESFGHEGDPGQWNPTLWALVVGIWTLVVGIHALHVHFDGEGWIDRLRFDVSSWLLALCVITPLWALIEWQDNGAFERWSNDSRPGDWEPWFLYIAGIWALVIAFRAIRGFADDDAD